MGQSKPTVHIETLLYTHSLMGVHQQMHPHNHSHTWHHATRRVIHIHKGAVSTNMKMLKAKVEVPVRTYCW